MDKFIVSEEQIVEAIKDVLMLSILDSQIVSILMNDIKDELHELLHENCKIVQDESEQSVVTEINVNYGSGEKGEETCVDMMEFPTSFDKFAKNYGFEDSEEVYTNGSDLIPVFRVKQWLEQDNKLRKVEIETAYECGKHASKWIPVSERMPEKTQRVLITIVNYAGIEVVRVAEYHSKIGIFQVKENSEQWKVGEKGLLAWMPLPEPYKAGEMAKADDALDKIKDEIVEEFGGCAICEWDEDYDWDENDISEWQPVGSIKNILDIIDKYRENRG